MDWLPALVEKLSSLYGVAILAIVMIVFYALLRSGRLVIKTKGVQIGKADVMEQERKIIRAQLHYLHITADGMISQLPSHLNPWRTKYILSKVCDVLEDAALYNHLVRGDEKYVEIKQKMIYGTVLKRTEDEWFKTQEFKDMCDKFVRDMIIEFMDIRDTYSKEQ